MTKKADWENHPELITAIKDCAVKGWSATQTAFYLSELSSLPISKNSVISKAGRLGVFFTSRFVPKRGARRKKSEGCSKTKPRRKQRSFNIKGTSLEDVEAPTILVTPAQDLAIPIEQRKTARALTNKVCNWPVGDPGTPEFFFCGAKQFNGGPYCEHHTTRAQQRSIKEAA